MARNRNRNVSAAGDAGTANPASADDEAQRIADETKDDAVKAGLIADPSLVQPAGSPTTEAEAEGDGEPAEGEDPATGTEAVTEAQKEAERIKADPGRRDPVAGEAAKAMEAARGSETRPVTDDQDEVKADDSVNRVLDVGRQPDPAPPAQDEVVTITHDRLAGDAVTPEAAAASAAAGTAADDPANAAPQESGFAEVKPERPFGEDPDDLDDDAPSEADDEDDPDIATTPLTYTGLKGPRGGRVEEGAFDPRSITVIVPANTDADDKGKRDYDGPFTEGTTYQFVRGQERPVRSEHVEWLRGYPAFHFETREDREAERE